MESPTRFFLSRFFKSIVGVQLVDSAKLPCRLGKFCSPAVRKFMPGIVRWLADVNVEVGRR